MSNDRSAELTTKPNPNDGGRAERAIQIKPTARSASTIGHWEIGHWSFVSA
jgi:hypothetical protein